LENYTPKQSTQRPAILCNAYLVVEPPELLPLELPEPMLPLEPVLPLTPDPAPVLGDVVVLPLLPPLAAPEPDLSK
jgi:hypothetical protein